jgi:ATPase/histidine kinase/DNA gyrase B/HSP90 domain protein
MRQVATLSTEVRNIVNKFNKAFYDQERQGQSLFTKKSNVDILAISLYAMRDGADPRVLHILEEGIVDLHQYLDDAEINTLLENYHVVMETLLGTMNTNSNRVMLPKEIVTLCSTLVSKSDDKRVYLPYAGDGSFLDAVASNAACIGFEQNEHLWAIGQILQQSKETAGAIRLGMPAEVRGKFDSIFTFPPIGIGTREEKDIVSHLSDLATNHLSENGRMACVLPASFCYTMGPWYQLRKTIIGNGLSVLAILLPERLLYPASNIELCVLIIENNHQGNITLVNATDKHFLANEFIESHSLRKVSLKTDAVVDTIKSGDEALLWSGSKESLNEELSFLPARYLPILTENQPAAGEVVLLVGSVVESVKGEFALRKNSNRVLTFSQLSDNYLTCDINVSDFPTKQYYGGRIITEDCLVVGYINGAIKIGRVSGVSESNPLALGLNMFAFKMRYVEEGSAFLVGNESVEPRKISSIITEDYLLRCLTSDIVLKQANALAVGIGIKRLRSEDFLSFKIYVPSLEEQDKRCKDDAATSVKDADARLLQTYEDFRKDMHMKKHALGQTLFNLNNWWKLLSTARKKGNGIVSDTDVLGVTKKMTVAEIFQNLETTMSKLNTQLSKFDTGYGLVKEEFALTEFLEQYIAEHLSPLFNFEYNADNHRHGYDLIEPWEGGKLVASKGDPIEYITFSKDALAMVLNNIISNACTHGFAGSEGVNNKIRMDIKSDGTSYVLTVANNGAPLKKDFTQDDVFIYGQTSGNTNEHFGIGGYEIKKLMKEFDGDVEIISSPEAEYTVTYKLIFHKTNILLTL